MLEKDKNYWENYYQNNDTGWDIGNVSPPIKQWLDKQADKSIRILIPGAGNGYEAEYAHNLGFENVYVADIAPSPLKNLKERVPSFPEDHLLLTDFFKLEDAFDVMIEQTFFCAIDPVLRKNYVEKASELLVSKGSLVGLLFDIQFPKEGPPFGGSVEEYKEFFEPYFDIKYMKTASNSVGPRLGNELWVEFKKRQ